MCICICIFNVFSLMCYCRVEGNEGSLQDLLHLYFLCVNMCMCMCVCICTCICIYVCMCIVHCSVLLQWKGMTRQLARWVANESESDRHQISRMLPMMMIQIMRVDLEWSHNSFKDQNQDYHDQLVVLDLSFFARCSCNTNLVVQTLPKDDWSKFRAIRKWNHLFENFASCTFTMYTAACWASFCAKACNFATDYIFAKDLLSGAMQFVLL